MIYKLLVFSHWQFLTAKNLEDVRENILYSSETLTLHAGQEQKLDTFRMPFMNISWKGKVPSNTVLATCEWMVVEYPRLSCTKR